MADSPNQPLFQEEQRFRQRWVWIIILTVSVASAAPSAWILIAALKPQDRSAGTATAALVFPLLLSMLPPLLFYWMRLWVRVEPNNLVVRFRPLLFKRISLSDIQSCEARSYRPIAEYGGWGIRCSLCGRGWAYNVSGNQGVQLELKNGKRILIGSQHAGELAEAINKARQAHTT